MEQKIRLDDEREIQLAKKRLKILEERERHRDALKQAKQQATVDMIKGAIAAKEEKIMYSDLTIKNKEAHQ